MDELGPVYDVPLSIRALPISGGMTQALPNRCDLQKVAKVSTRAAAGYEVLLARYIELLNENERLATFVDAAPKWMSVTTAPPLQRFVSGKGWQPTEKVYVLAVDAKGRMSVGYASEHDGYACGYRWTFAKPISEPTHWMPLPTPPKGTPDDT